MHIKDYKHCINVLVTKTQPHISKHACTHTHTQPHIYWAVYTLICNFDCTSKIHCHVFHTIGIEHK